MRRPLSCLLGAAALSAAITIPAMAASPGGIDEGRVAGTTLSLALPHGGTLSLDIRAGILSAGPRLMIFADDCAASGYCEGRTYSSPLPVENLQIDPSAARAELTTVLDGRPLSIQWHPNGGYFVGGTVLYASGDGADASTYAGEGAAVIVSVGGAGCAGTGGVGTEVAASPDTPVVSSNAQPVSTLELPKDATLTCA